MNIQIPHLRVGLSLMLVALAVPALLFLWPQTTLFAKLLPAPAVATTAFTYQGVLTDQAAPANGQYNLSFLLFDAESAGNQLGVPVYLAGVPVVDGLFTVQLDFGTAVWNGEPRWLETQVNGTPLTPRQLIGTVPYAIAAQTVPWNGISGRPADLTDGDNDTTYSAGTGLTLTGTQFNVVGVPYANVVIVAKHGGHFTSVGAAVADITDATAQHPYLVWVAPGVYTETLTMKPYIDIAGAGEERTILTNRVTAPAQAVPIVTVTDDAVLKDVTVQLYVDFPSADTGSATAIMGDMTVATIERVTVRVDAARGNTINGVWLKEGRGELRDLRVDIRCTIESYFCTGIYNNSSVTSLRNGTISVAGAQDRNTGIDSSGTTLPAFIDVWGSLIQVTSPREGDIRSASRAISMSHGASLNLRQSVLHATGGTTQNRGINIYDTDGPGTHQVNVNHTEIYTADNGAHAVRNSHIVRYTVRLGASLVGGPIYLGLADLRCVGSYDEEYIALDGACE